MQHEENRKPWSAQPSQGARTGRKPQELEKARMLLEAVKEARNEGTSTNPTRQQIYANLKKFQEKKKLESHQAMTDEEIKNALENGVVVRKKVRN